MNTWTASDQNPIKLPQDRVKTVKNLIKASHSKLLSDVC